MPWTLRGRRPRERSAIETSVSTSEQPATHLEDAAHFAGGHADEVFTPRSEGDVARILARSRRALVIGAQSSLTGGATPMGDTLISTARLNRILSIDGDTVRVQAGVTLADLDEALRPSGVWYPPSPTFTGAFVGGVVSTNAAGAATFKYGATRPWVKAITVVLASGDVFDIQRGVTFAHPDGYFDLDMNRGTVRVPIPRYVMPSVAKLSAGYFARAGMDLIDLFIGSEGTLGVITEVTLGTTARRPASCPALSTFANPHVAWALAERLRQSARLAWRSGDPRDLDVASIEYLDARSLALLREDQVDQATHVTLPDEARAALLVTLDFPAGTTAASLYDGIGRAAEPEAPDTAITRLCSLLLEHGALDTTTIAAPGDRARASQLLKLREAVPAAVNQRVGHAKLHLDARIQKTAADVIVPVEQLEVFVDTVHAEFDRRHLDGAVWGHVSDGNVHPNVIPQGLADVERGEALMLALGLEAIRLGGAPLAEHGVGRHPVKQALLRELYGREGVDEMKRVKRALDPEWKLAPGVVFAA